MAACRGHVGRWRRRSSSSSRRVVRSVIRLKSKPQKKNAESADGEQYQGARKAPLSQTCCARRPSGTPVTEIVGGRACTEQGGVWPTRDGGECTGVGGCKSLRAGGSRSPACWRLGAFLGPNPTVWRDRVAGDRHRVRSVLARPGQSDRPAEPSQARIAWRGLTRALRTPQWQREQPWRAARVFESSAHAASRRQQRSKSTSALGGRHAERIL